MIFIEGPLELSDDGWDFDPGEKDSLLSLEGDVLGPSDEPGEIPLGLDIIANSEVAGLALEERVSFSISLLCNFL